jgi:hypothetical protein
MKKWNNWGIVILLTGFVLPSYAQYASDAFRFSEIHQTGSARFQGIGGGHASLGGDVSSLVSNPAGLGFYTRSEMNISGGLTSINTNSNYIGQPANDSKLNPNLTQFSFVFAGTENSPRRKWRRSAWGISYSRQQSFQNSFMYSGLNTESAMVDKAIDDANYFGYTVGDLENDFDNNYAYSLPAAYYQLYMLDPTTESGPPYLRFDDINNNPISPSRQTGSFDSKGAHTQWTLAYGGNYDDKLYIGGSVGLSKIRYDYTHTLRDDFTSNNSAIRTSVYDEQLRVNGSGVNASLGMIYKPNRIFQVGVNLTTPTYTWISETFSELISADNDFIEMAPNDFDYRLTSPFRGSVGGTYFAGANGFITGTLEFVGYQGMGLSTTQLSSDQNADFKRNNRTEISNTFKNAVNARIGGEYRLGVTSLRAGLAYMSDPYKSQPDNIRRQRIIPSLGAGFRTERFYMDISGSYTGYKSTFTPYMLDQYAFYDANIQNKRVNVVLSLGTYF